MSAPSTWEDIRRTEMLRALGDLLRKRALIAPFAITMMTILFWVETATWRRALIAGMVPVMVIVVFVERRRAMRGALDLGAAGLNAGVMLGGAVAALIATGGIESPGTPALALMTVMATVLASERAARRIWLSAMATIVVFTVVQVLDRFPEAMPDLFGGASHRPVPWMAFARGFVLAIVTTASYLITSRVRVAIERMAERAGAASRAVADGLADEHRTLAALTAEIAHELKNPLASVKGLAGLVAKDVDGRTAERMAVLRREVDRMQEVLEQFLNLSRPVVPLEVAPVDPRALCDEVAALHEGAAAERGVRIEVRGARDLALAADARKLHQVLTNLVQNALAASPRGATIAIEARRGDDGGVALAVLDEGPGLAADVAARAFEPGVTTKPDGSGLGLAIARSLARQHGGDLELSARDGGGVAAIVRIP